MTQPELTLTREAAPPPPAPILDVRGLRVSFAGADGRTDAVRDVSFSVHPGEIVALVGESGSGKSVTARTLVGLAGDHARVEAETLAFDGRDVRRLGERAWQRLRGREIGFVLQDALVSLDPLRTIGREVAEPLLAHRLVRRDRVAGAVQDALVRAGVPEPELRAGQRSFELSGGLRQRALIATAIAPGPRLIIADEPTTALDVTVQAQILDLLASIADDGTGVLLITHDLAVVANIAHRVLVLKDGAVVEEGTTAEILTDPRHAYTRRLLAAVPSAATRGRPLSAPAEALPTPVVPRRSTPDRGRPVLSIEDVSVEFAGRRAVDHVSLHVERGETLGIVGESGSGKTTLGRAALALQRLSGGRVLLDGEAWSDTSEARRRDRRRRIQVISQDPLSSFNPQYTVERLLAQPLRLHPDAMRVDRREDSERLLAQVGLGPEFLRRRPLTLSGGQRQRVAIAQALAATPDLIVCDEPVSALDVSTQAQVLDLLVDLQDRLGLALLFISHDLGVVHHVSHRIAVMKDGRVVEEGDVEQVFRAPQHPYTRDLLSAVPRIPPRAESRS